MPTPPSRAGAPSPGRLYLVPNLLGIVPPEDVLPARTLAVARRLGHFVVENAKPARLFLKTLGAACPLQQLAIAELGERPTPQRCAELLGPARAGADLGLLSDAGCPGVADPGALLVAAAHREGIVVVPLVGPSAILLALMASGMNGQGFAFHGYLPVKAGRARRRDPAARGGVAARRLGAAVHRDALSQRRADHRAGRDLPARHAAVRRGRPDHRHRVRRVARDPRLAGPRSRRLRAAAGDVRAAGVVTATAAGVIFRSPG